MQEVCIKSLAVTYFHMGKPHTIIGAKQFHFRVRDGIGWFPLANAARQTVRKEIGDRPRFSKNSSASHQHYFTENRGLSPISSSIFGKL
jgi:hypothetical protein